MICRNTCDIGVVFVLELWRGGPIRRVRERQHDHHKGNTHPRIRYASRLYEDDLLNKLDSRQLHAAVRRRRPHKLQNTVLALRKQVPLLARCAVCASNQMGRRKRVRSVTGHTRRPLYCSSSREEGVPYRVRKRSGYTVARHCMATLTVRTDESFSRLASVSTD